MAFQRLKDKVVRPQELCFTQDSISVTFKRPREQERIDHAVDLIRQGMLSPKAFPKMNVVESQDRLWSLDNRRLWVFKKAEVRYITVTIVAFDFGEGFHSLMSTSPYLYYTMSKPDFFPRIRGFCKENFTEEEQDLPSSPPLPSTPHHARVRPPEMPTKVYKRSNSSAAGPFPIPKPHTSPKRARSPPPPKVAKVSARSRHLDYDDYHYHRRHHHYESTPFKSQNSDAPPVPRMRSSVSASPHEITASPQKKHGSDHGPSQTKKRPHETEHHRSRTPLEACTPSPAKKSRAPVHEGREFRASPPAAQARDEEISSPPPAKKPRTSSHHQVREVKTPSRPPVPITPLQRPKAPRPPPKETYRAPPPRKPDAPSPAIKPRTATRSSDRTANRPGILPSCRSTVEPKALRSDRPPSREERTDHQSSAARPPLPKDELAQRGREASSTSRAVDKPPPPPRPAPKRSKPPKQMSSPPNFSYDFHSLGSKKRSKGPNASKKTVSTTPSTKSSSTQLDGPLSASPMRREDSSKVPPAPLPSLSTTAGPSATSRKRERGDNFTPVMPVLLAQPAPKLPPIVTSSPTKTSHPGELHASRFCPDQSKNHHHGSTIGTSPTTWTTQESPGLVDRPPQGEVMTERERNLFQLEKQAPSEPVDTEMPLPLTPCKVLSPQDKQTLDSIIELFLRDVNVPYQPAQAMPTKVLLDTQKEPSEALVDQLPLQTPLELIVEKRQQDTSVPAGSPTSVVSCPVQYDTMGQLFESTLKNFGPLSNPSTAFYGDGDVHLATGNVGVTVKAALEPTVELKETSTPGCEGEIEGVTQFETKGKAATDSQQVTPQEKIPSSRSRAFQETCLTANNEVSLGLSNIKRLHVLSTCANDVPDPSKPITRSQSRKQKDLERRKAREKKKETEREAKAKNEREAGSKAPPKAPPKAPAKTPAKALPKEKSQAAPRKMTTQIVPYDPERSKKIVQTGDSVYVKVSGELTGSNIVKRKGVPRTTLRLHPYLRVIGPFRVERKFNGFVAMLAFPDDCQLKPNVNIKFLLKSRSPTDSYLPYSRLSIKLEPEKILNKRVARRLKKHKVLHYLVKWKALPATEATWEPETIFHEHPHLLDQIDSPLFSNPYLLRNWRA